MNQEEYNAKFDVKNEKSLLLKAAFEQVSDIRKFEIELYWKRATYFWALIAVAFAGYFSILASEKMPNKFFLSFVVSCIGFVFTFAWFLSSRGSKYWQENWENHLDLLEDHVTGPLYKTLLERPKHESFAEKYVTGPISVSVSKINQWVSIYIVFAWIILIVFSAFNSLQPLGISSDKWSVIFMHIFIFLFTLSISLVMLKVGKTHKNKHSPIVVERKTEIE
ncbi:RipA family octameric membrane protein [Enterobacter cancerogenus]|uniref:RipA family octameric membrane protein n=1 Tax=Enterobacter cancerogenus TaxID=69218 RepID=UPI003FA3C2D9